MSNIIKDLVEAQTILYQTSQGLYKLARNPSTSPSKRKAALRICKVIKEAMDDLHAPRWIKTAKQLAASLESRQEQRKQRCRSRLAALLAKSILDPSGAMPWHFTKPWYRRPRVDNDTQTAPWRWRSPLPFGPGRGNPPHWQTNPQPQGTGRDSRFQSPSPLYNSGEASCGGDDPPNKKPQLADTAVAQAIWDNRHRTKRFGGPVQIQSDHNKILVVFPKKRGVCLVPHATGEQWTIHKAYQMTKPTGKVVSDVEASLMVKEVFDTMND